MTGDDHSMNREEVRQYIINHSTEYLKQDRTGKGWICPLCESGSRKSGTGITTKDGVHFTCWHGCFTNSDIIDIIGKQYGLTDYNQKLQKAAEAFGVSIEGHAVNLKESASENQKKAESEQYTQLHTHNHTDTNPEEPEADYTDFFLQANSNIEKTEYHRGLTLETLNRFKIGYVESWKHPKAPNTPASPRLIIPTSQHSYIARDTRANLTENQKKYSKSKVGHVRIFNSHALWESDKPVFVVEGELDALSIIDVGGQAIGLGSVVMKNALLKMLENQRPSQPLILAMDDDPVGQTASKELSEGLVKLKIPFCVVDIATPCKDANEALNKDRESFRTAVEQAEAMGKDVKIMEAVDTEKEQLEETQVVSEEQAKLEAEREELKKEAASSKLQNFIDDIVSSGNAPFFPTGFKELDKLLDGGLYSGLYIVGAISSLGKTTFCLQIADRIAQQGQDVLIFSLEMASKELIAKSVSRITLIKDLEENTSTAHAKTTRGILTGSRYEKYSQMEQDLIAEAVNAYGEYAGNIYITEGIGDVSISKIKEKVEKHIRLTGKAPVVVIDYLQIVAPNDVRATDKQNTDKAVLELKRLSRDYKIPVLGISSFNRENYTAPVNLAAFKESGAIEYSSDVLIGLQYEGMDYREGESDKERQKRIRELEKETQEQAREGNPQSIQVKVLKNRNGSKGSTVLKFYPMFNYFTDNADTVAKEEDSENGDWTDTESSYK